MIKSQFTTELRSAQSANTTRRRQAHAVFASQAHMRLLLLATSLGLWVLIFTGYRLLIG